MTCVGCRLRSSTASGGSSAPVPRVICLVERDVVGHVAEHVVRDVIRGVVPDCFVDEDANVLPRRHIF